MTAKSARLSLLGIAAAYGAASGFFAANDQNVPRVVEFIVTLLLMGVTYGWYYLDAAEKNYHRTTPLGGAIIFIPMFAIPYYLARSRARGQKIKSVLWFVAFCVLCLMAMLIAAMPFLFLTRVN